MGKQRGPRKDGVCSESGLEIAKLWIHGGIRHCMGSRRPMGAMEEGSFCRVSGWGLEK